MTRPAAAWNSVVMCAMLVSPLHGVVPHLVPRSAQSVHLSTCVRPGTSTFAQPSASSLCHHYTHSSVHSRSLACVGLYAVFTIITAIVIIRVAVAMAVAVVVPLVMVVVPLLVAVVMVMVMVCGDGGGGGCGCGVWWW